MYEKLLSIGQEYDRLAGRMATQEVASNPDEYRKCAQAQSKISDVVAAFRRFQKLDTRLREAKELLRSDGDPDMRTLALQEIEEIGDAPAAIEQELKVLLLPRDPNDEKNTIVEIRAGTGGDEASLFAADLYRMYQRYAEARGWKVELMSANGTGVDGYKMVSFKIEGELVYSQLKFEGGVHRVQRVPATEAQGRIHTSAVTVAVLPEAEEVDIQINESDLTIDVYRSSGPGGQSVNTTDSAVRVTHRPTGLVVTCQDEKSQHKNKAKALMVLRARLLAAKEEEEARERSAARKIQVGSGDRSEKIRTYNFPENRVTDHRINKSIYNLKSFISGEIQEMVDALVAADRAARMEID